jgi:predicted nucleic acid-binding protein
MYLIDTNIWLERLLDQARSQEVGRFLDTFPSDQLLMTDFTFHSIGVVLNRLGQEEAFLRFIEDVFIDGAVTLVSVQPQEMQRLVDTIREFNLDFDDAYQYAAADKFNASVVSFDTDFDRTERGKKSPEDLL